MDCINLLNICCMSGSLFGSTLGRGAGEIGPQFIHYHQITMQSTSFQGYRLLIKNLLRSKQISAVDRKIFMIRKLVFCPSQMVKLFMFARSHHQIYQAVLHVLSGISMAHIWSLATLTKEQIC